MDGKTHSTMDERMRACIEQCNNCHDTCTETVAHGLQMGGEHADPSHIRLLLDCAEICQTSANFMLRMSEFHSQTCGVCADVCERCEEDCERFGDDQMMQQCAEVCRSCAPSCREMAEMHTMMAVHPELIGMCDTIIATQSAEIEMMQT